MIEKQNAMMSGMNQLGKRLFSSVFFVSISLLAIFGPHWFFMLCVLALTGLALFEFYQLAELKGVPIAKEIGVACGLLMPFAMRLSLDGLFLILACLLIFTVYFKPGKREHGLVGVGLTFFGLVYVSWFFSHAVAIRELDQGSYWLLYTALLVKGGDAGAYFVGKKYGRTKLIEPVSPNKSVEGAWGGFATTIVLSLLSFLYLPDVSFLNRLFLGACVAVIAQLSDLAESLIKRDVHVKDSGKVPGLGGFLDVLDSLLLTLPFVYYYLTRILALR